MARIKVLQAISGLEFSWAAGDVVDLPGDEATKWADGYRAELVRAEKPERAVVSPPAETATTPKTRARKA